jgi:replicative DNA helicase
VASRARRMKRKRKIELLVIDYLQLMRGGRADGNRVQEITTITTGLKALAKELAIPLVLVSQLNRQAEARTDKRPQLYDLRESGSIEQDADVVIFLYREEYYVRREKPSQLDVDRFADWSERLMRCAGKAELLIAKNRQGPVENFEIACDASLMRFSDLAQEG